MTQNDPEVRKMSEKEEKVFGMKRPKSALGVGNKCRDLCGTAKFVKGSRYEKGQRYCKTCECWVREEAVIISKGVELHQCCHSKLRTKPKNSPKQIISIEGNRALDFFNITMAVLKEGIHSLPKWFKHHELGVARTKILIVNIELAIAFLCEIIKYKRQNITRIELKEQKIKKYIEKLMKSLPKY